MYTFNVYSQDHPDVGISLQFRGQVVADNAEEAIEAGKKKWKTKRLVVQWTEFSWDWLDKAWAKADLIRYGESIPKKESVK